MNSILRNLAFVLYIMLASVYSNTAIANLVSRDTAVNPPLNVSTYNDTIYNSVLEAAVGIAQPYLLQQKYYTMQGVTVSGNSIIYDGVTYPVSESYFNPGTGYYIASTVYNQYGIGNFSSVWPTQCPNAFYDSSTKTFFSKIDCVGFGTRLLSAVGGLTSSTNAYVNLLNRLHSNNVTPFASKGFVASAYQFGVAFPTLKTAPKPGWEYISGNVCATSVIDGYNHVIRSTVGTYNGVRKGGFGLCKAGDVLAFSYDSTSSSNGHWMVIESAPTALSASALQTYYPKVSSTKVKAFTSAHRVYAVPVIDDSGKSAHFNDSRSSYSGIGHGTVLIVADTADDAPVGFIFSPSSNTSITYSAVDTTHCYAISVGRFTTTAQLPVTISSFTATIQKSSVEIKWNTANEINTSIFRVQRSSDGVNFTELGSKPAIGSGVNIYNFSDNYPNNGIWYYRIECIDKDGNITYSKIISCNVTNDIANSQLKVFPNPSKEKFVIMGNHINLVKIINSNGNLVSSIPFRDKSNPSIKVGNLINGLYHILIQNTEGKTSLIEFVKD